MNYYFFVNDDRIEIPPDVVQQILSDEKPQAAPDDLFESIFSAAEIDSLQTIANDAEYETDALVALRQFTEQIPAIQSAPLIRRYEMALNIARQIFDVAD